MTNDPSGFTWDGDTLHIAPGVYEVKTGKPTMTKLNRKRLQEVANELLATVASRVELNIEQNDDRLAFCLLYLAETIRQQGENLNSSLDSLRDSVERGG